LNSTRARRSGVVRDQLSNASRVAAGQFAVTPVWRTNAQTCVAMMQQAEQEGAALLPEVARVFGKTGKAETATDSAPLEMVETTIQLKPQDQWRP
ncbi:hypothetical protein FK513_31185, partial [Klebsiella pneumoniae]|uniref:hypothetical protein n=1 Tax=Klebsiella pneumoniae TaxID=573 RepID=UPI00210C4A0F